MAMKIRFSANKVITVTDNWILLCSQSDIKRVVIVVIQKKGFKNIFPLFLFVTFRYVVIYQTRIVICKPSSRCYFYEPHLGFIFK